jgi:hypothetical protein
MSDEEADDAMNDDRTPAAIALDDAIDASLEGRQLFPDRAMFINAEWPHLGAAIAGAADEDRAIVLCFEDGRRYVFTARRA